MEVNSYFVYQLGYTAIANDTKKRRPKNSGIVEGQSFH